MRQLRVLLAFLTVGVAALALAYGQGAVTWGQLSRYLPDGSVQVALPSAYDGGFNCFDAGTGNGCYNIFTVDGGIIDAGFTTYTADGGWVNGGFLCGYIDAGNGYAGACAVVDAGFATYDGGVCADGGADCAACSGTCLQDGGWVDGGPMDAGLIDGGFSTYVGDGGWVDGGFNIFLADGGWEDGGWVDGGQVNLFASDLYTATKLITVQCVISGSGHVSGGATLQLQGTDDLYPSSGSPFYVYPSADGGVAFTDSGYGVVTLTYNLPAAWTEIYIPVDTFDGGVAACTYSSQ